MIFYDKKLIRICMDSNFFERRETDTEISYAHKSLCFLMDLRVYYTPLFETDEHFNILSLLWLLRFQLRKDLVRN